MSGTPIGHDKLAALEALMQRAGIVEADLEERFVRASGPGGQKVNKTSSAVQLRHNPSGEEVRCQASRSQAYNRYAARKQLAERLLAKIEGTKSAQAQAIEKLRRQKRKRSRRAKQKVLADKRHDGAKKATRQRPSSSD